MRYRRLIILIISELMILSGVCLYSLSQGKDTSVRNPEISQWQSRYTVFDNGYWHCDASCIPEEDKGGVTDILYGPFFSLEAGNYSISVDYDCDEDQSFQVYSFGSPDAVIVHEPEKLISDRDSATYHFTLLDRVEDLEVRFRYNGNGSYDIRNVNVISSRFLLKEIMLVLFAVFAVLDICVFAFHKYREDGTRELWIDVCRGIGIILVLIGHDDPPFKWLIFGFHMPLFFILSGYLYKHCENTGKYAARLFRQYIVPYYLFAVLNLVIRLIQMSIEDSVTPEWVARYVFHGIADAGEWLPNALPLWFLPALFVTMLIMHFLHSGHFSLFQRIIIVFICIAAAAFTDRFDCGYFPWNADRALMGLVFAEFGYLLKQKDIIGKIDGLRICDKAGLLAIILICGVNAVRYNYESTGEIPAMQPMRFGHMQLWIAGAVLLSVWLMSICSIIGSSRIRKIMIPLSVLGRNTLVFFAFDFCAGTFGSKILYGLLGYEPWYFKTPVKFLLLIPPALLYNIFKHKRSRTDVSGNGGGKDGK